MSDDKKGKSVIEMANDIANRHKTILSKDGKPETITSGATGSKSVIEIANETAKKNKTILTDAVEQK